MENDSDDSEDELMNAKEHENAELGYMFQMEGVDYDDEEEEKILKKKKKYKDFHKYDKDIAVQEDLEEVTENDDNDADSENENDDAGILIIV